MMKMVNIQEKLMKYMKEIESNYFEFDFINKQVLGQTYK